MQQQINATVLLTYSADAEADEQQLKDWLAEDVNRLLDGDSGLAGKLELQDWRLVKLEEEAAIYGDGPPLPPEIEARAQAAFARIEESKTRRRLEAINVGLEYARQFVADWHDDEGADQDELALARAKLIAAELAFEQIAQLASRSSEAQLAAA